VILVDTNVLLDVFGDDPRWAGWSQQALDAASLRASLCINPVVYAETSVAFRRIEELEKVLDEVEITVVEMPREALFLAGKAFLNYRRQRGSTRTSVLPDFFVGAHAAVTGAPLITRDSARYAAYFPTVELIAPRHGSPS
jgi:predicted nucleic acid-binding protein